MKPPFTGRLVLYVLAQGDRVAWSSIGEERPALIVAWPDESPSAAPCANLLVFLDGHNDALPATNLGLPLYWPFPAIWKQAAPHSPNREPGTWREIPE